MDAPNNPTYEYQVGGSLKINAPCYVWRQADEDLYASLQEGAFCYVFNCRQMGKSSLRVQVMQRLKAEGFSCGAIDLTTIGSGEITADKWYRGLILELHRIFKLSKQVNLKTWLADSEQLPPVQRLSLYLEEVLLAQVGEGRIVIFIDEIDSVLKLNFPTSDFFALIRACYNQRADNPAFERLTFVLLGVATPADLVQDAQQTPFNIGRAIALEGLEFEKSAVLAEGLVGKAENPSQVLLEILQWTGGQPFLTQKLCQIVRERVGEVIRAGEEAHRVKQLVQAQILDNWEFQDDPQHLRTIRDRLLNNEQKAGRLLGLYQQILEQGSVIADGSSEQMDLKLSGLAVKRGDRLVVYNPIYQEIFNRHWLEEELNKLRDPFYSEAITAWLASGKQDESRLLRGQALRKAQEWAKGKSLGDEDYQFLRSSEELAKGQVEQALETQKQANSILEEAKQKLEEANRTLEEATQEANQKLRKANSRIGIGTAILIISLIGAAIATATAFTLNKNNGELKIQNSSLEKDNQDLTDSNTKLNGDNTKLSQQRKDLEENIKKAEKEIQTKNEKLRQAETKVKVAFDNQQKSQQLALLAKGNQQKAEQVRKQAETDLAQAKNERQIAIQDMEVAKGELRKLNQERQAIGQQLQIEQAKLKQAQEELLMAKNVTKLEQQGFNIARQFEFRELDSLLAAIRSGQELKKLGKKQQDSLDYPTLTPLTSLLTILTNIHEKNKLEQHQGTVQKVVFSPDGKMFASLSDNGEAKLWKRDGTIVENFTVPLSSKIAFNADGQILIAYQDARQIKVWMWDGNNFAEKTNIKGCGGSSELAFPLSFDWSSDGEIIAISCFSGKDEKVELWKQEGELLTTFSTYQEDISKSIKFSPDKQFIVTHLGRENEITLWRWDKASKVKLIKTLKLEDGEFISRDALTFHPNGKLLAMVVIKPVGSGANSRLVSSLKILNLDGTLLGSLSDNRTLTLPLSISWGVDKDLVTGNEDGSLTLWTWNYGMNNYQIQTLKRHNNSVNSVAFSPDGELIISGSDDKTIKVWGRNRGEVMFTQGGFAIYKHTNLWAFWVDWLDSLTAEGQDDGTIKIIKHPDETVIDTLKGHSRKVLGVSWSPNGKYLVSASADQTVKLWSWNGTKGALIKTFSSEVEQKYGDAFTYISKSNSIFPIVFSPNSEIFASGDVDGNIIIWNQNGKLLTLTKAHQSVVNSLSFSVDGEFIASGDRQGTIKLWKKDGTLVRIFNGHTQEINSIAFSGDGKLIVSSSPDRINIWEEDGSILASFLNLRNILFNVAFSNDGKSLLVDPGNGFYTQWSLNIDDLIGKGCLWLEDYLTSHPDEAQDVRQICQNYTHKVKR